MRLLMFRVGLAVFSLTLTLAMAELFVRLASPQPVSWLAIYRSHPVLPTFSMLPNQTLHVDTGETEWTVLTDESGFRVSSNPNLEADCTALWLGDSFAFGHGVEYEESFIGRIEAENSNVRHVNAAVSGYGPVQYRQTLEYLGKHDGRGAKGLDFDWVFVATFVGNDFHDTEWDKSSTAVDGILGNQGDLKSFLKRTLHSYRLVSAAYHRFADDDQEDKNALTESLSSPDAWKGEFLSAASQHYASEMQRIYDYVTSRGKQVVFLIIPTREAAVQNLATLKGGAVDRQPMLPVEHARAILDEIGARFIDLTPVVGAFPAKEMFFRFDGHLTPKANQLVADEFNHRVSLRCSPLGDESSTDQPSRTGQRP